MSEEKKDDWQLVGWLGLSKTGKAITVTVDEHRVGIVSKQALDNVLSGAKQGAPIKVPPKQTA